jgi:hypothetical protein
MSNKSYVEQELRWYFNDYKDMGWKRDSDALDGDLALSTGGTTSKTLTAQGVATANHKGAKVPDISNRKIIKQMALVKQQSPELYDAARFIFGSEKELNEAMERTQTLVAVLGKVL